MATDWSNRQKLEGVASAEYDDAAIDYDDPLYNYDGQVMETWNNQEKS